MINAAENAAKIVEALKETEAESEATRVLSARAVELLHQAGLTRIVSPAAYGGYQLPVRALVEAERVVAHGSTAASWVVTCTLPAASSWRCCPEPGEVWISTFRFWSAKKPFSWAT